MRDDFSFLEGTPPRARPRNWVYAPIISPTPKVSVDVFGLAEYPVGFLLHFVGQHRICVQNSGCQWCKQGLGRDWKAFLPAVSLDYKKRYIMAVTEQANEDLNRIRDRFGSICHSALLFKREGTKRNGPVRISDTLRKPDKSLLPAPFDVRPGVLCVHGFDVDTVVRIMEQWQMARNDS